MSTATVSPRSGRRQARGWQVVAAPACAVRTAKFLPCLLLSFFFIRADASNTRSSVTAATSQGNGVEKQYDPRYVASLLEQLKLLKEDEDAHAAVLQSLLKANVKESKKRARTAGIVGGAGLLGSGLAFLGALKAGKRLDALEDTQQWRSQEPKWTGAGVLHKSLLGASILGGFLTLLGFITAARYGIEARQEKKAIPGRLSSFREAIAKRRQELEKSKLGKLPEEVAADEAEETSWAS